jgi:hypothetical protein
MSFDLQPDLEPLLLLNAKEAKERKRAEVIAKAIKDRSEYLQEQIALANSRMEQYANAGRQPSPNYQPSDKVWLSMRNIKTQRPAKKLDNKNVLCTIVQRISRDSYELRLPEGMQQLHLVFHTSLLQLDPEDPLPGQHIEP